MARRWMVGVSRVAGLAAAGVLVAAGCGGGSEAKQAGGAAGSTGDGTAGHGQTSSSSGGSKASGGTDANGGKNATGGSGQGDGGVSPSGGASEGGSGATTGGTTGSSGGSSTGGAPAQLATVGEDCSPPGALACSDASEKLIVVCGGDRTWEALETCEGSLVCYSGSGPNAGSCQEPPSKCEGQPAGFRFCVDNSVFECDASAAAGLVEECAVVCAAGKCVAPDPCPEGDQWYNCAEDCGGAGEQCQWDGFGCNRVPAVAELPITVRTPARLPNCFCWGEGADRQLFYALVSAGTYRVTVDAPWWATADTEECTGSVSPSSCYIVVVADLGLVITTDDPSAQPQNAYIERVPAGTECP